MYILRIGLCVNKKKIEFNVYNEMIMIIFIMVDFFLDLF